MVKVFLVPHQVEYAKKISFLSSSPQVKDVLGLKDEQTSLEGTIDFINFILEEEKLEKQYSRVILNEDEEPIGIITLKNIDKTNKSSHIGTWIGHQYWGKGYNELAKAEILNTAFTKLDLEYVFAGAKKINIRSQKAQEKLPYMRIDVESEFAKEHKELEAEADAPCILNVIEKDIFLNWYSGN